MTKSRKELKTMDEYIASFPKDVRIILDKIRREIRRAAPQAEEGISYGIPAFKLAGKDLVYFAGWKNHIGFYPIPSGANAFKTELARYKQGKGSVQFPLVEPIPYDLIRRIVKYRTIENLANGPRLHERVKPAKTKKPSKK
jgi:uncharacterized protein YdhG (YjbR/CyaY superfamily)